MQSSVCPRCGAPIFLEATAMFEDQATTPTAYFSCSCRKTMPQIDETDAEATFETTALVDAKLMPAPAESVSEDRVDG